jgi:regulator of RNase E activity RraA
MAGAIIDGSVRDAPTMIKSKCPVFCAGTQPLACHFVMTTLSIQEPVVCAGVHVCPGDYVIADMDGVVFVPPEYAEDVLKLSLEKAVAEEKREKALWEVPVELLDEKIVNNPEMHLPSPSHDA